VSGECDPYKSARLGEIAAGGACRFLCLTSGFLVELPGIEPAANPAVACGNAEFDDSKRRETT
jgi:hypothetical protein